VHPLDAEAGAMFLISIFLCGTVYVILEVTSF
jgi:hypothetical protein